MKSLVSKLFISAAATSALAFSYAAQAAAPLVTPAELQQLQATPVLRVIDIRPSKDYQAKHIPGAISAPYGEWRGSPTNPGDLPPLAKLTTLVQALGLSPQSHAVVVSSGADSTDFGASARVYWTLKVLGLSQLSILNGGVNAWSEAGLAQDANVVKVAASQYVPKLDTSLIATRDQVAAQIDNPNTRLLDARPVSFFEGDARHPAAKSAGTIHNAVNLDNDKWFKPGTSIFVSLAEAKKIAANAPHPAATETVAFCNTGHWAATDWFALSEIVGEKNVKLYPGSMVDWTQASVALPMDNVPGRAKKIMSDAKTWASKTF